MFMIRFVILVSLIANALAAPTVLAQSSADFSADSRVSGCLVHFINRVDVSAEVDGRIAELPIDDGSTLAKGELMAKIDDTASKLTLTLSQAKEKEAVLNASNDINLRDARNSRELAIAQYESARELFNKQAVPRFEMLERQLEAERARLKIELAETQLKQAEAQYLAARAELNLAEFEVTRRRVVAPFAGVVDNRVAQLGEWVQPGSPIATLVQMDRVRVVGVVDVVQSDVEVAAGMPVRVHVEVRRTQRKPEVFDGVIGFVSADLNLNQEARIWVDIENRKNALGGWLVKPGMSATIDILPGGGLIQ